MDAFSDGTYTDTWESQFDPVTAANNVYWQDVADEEAKKQAWADALARAGSLIPSGSGWVSSGTAAPATPTGNSMAPLQAYQAQQMSGKKMQPMNSYQSGNYAGLAPMNMYQQTQAAPVATTPTTTSTQSVGGK